MPSTIETIKGVDYYYDGVTDEIRYRLYQHALELPPWLRHSSNRLAAK